MTALRWLQRDRFGLLSGLVALLVVAAALFVIVASVTGRAPFEFVDNNAASLADDENIDAWITLDKPSYHQGDIVRYRLRLQWRDSEVLPDLESFERSISFYPFDRRSAAVRERRPGVEIREYVADFFLQPVNVEAPSTYQLDTATVFYSLASEGHTDVHALRATPPPVYLGEFYPDDVQRIATLPTKPRIDDAGSLRSLLMAIAGTVLLAIACGFVWQRGRKRPYTELSAAEQLWRDFDTLRHSPEKDRDYLIASEHIFTRALELRAGVPATEFWTADTEIDEQWRALHAEGRSLFAAGYRHDEPAVAEITAAEALIDRLLAPVIKAERLERERHDRFSDRLRSQPRVLGVAGLLSVAALAALGFAVSPSTWLAADIGVYNDGVSLLEDESDPQAALDVFLGLTEAAEEPRVKAAALYNSGTLLADFRLTRLSRAQYNNFLSAIFLPEITLDRLLHDMELDAEFELVTLLSDITRRYVHAEEMLKAAVRVDPSDADAQRNLELLAKIRKAIGRSLAQLVRQGEPGEGSEQMLSQTVIDLKLLMESELPEDFAREDEGKDDRDYFIMERF